MKLKIRRTRTRAKKLKIRRSTTTKRNTTLLTRTNKQIIYEGIRIGLPFTRACILAGLDAKAPSLFRKYGENPKNRKFFDFICRCDRIAAEREMEALNVIRLASKGGQEFEESKIKIGPRGTETTSVTKVMLPQWQAAAWYVERRDKEFFGREASESNKTPEEFAEEIRQASIEVFNSVPTAPEEK